MSRYYANHRRVKVDPDSWHDDLDRVEPDTSSTPEIRAQEVQARAIIQAQLEATMKHLAAYRNSRLGPR